MGWLHRTRAWYVLAAVYTCVAVARLPRPLKPAALALRLALVGASSASVWISDGYHNPDVRGVGAAELPEDELSWLRLDYTSISMILSTNLWLWGSHLGWIGALRPLSKLSALATALVATTAATIVPKRAGHIGIKLTLAVQFVGFLGYLVSVAAKSPIQASIAVYLCYLPGFALYATKWPKTRTFGYHEYFHSSVLLGHLASMGFDLAVLSAAL